jgi:hypothetical protein
MGVRMAWLLGAAVLAIAPATSMSAASPPPARSPSADGGSVLTDGISVRPLGAAAAAAVAAEAPQPEGPRWPLFADAEHKVGSAALVVDGQDGIHLAYAQYVPQVEEPKAAYAYCPAEAACGKGEGWMGVEFGEHVSRVMLATTSDGHPRMLLQQDGRVVSGGKDHHYAACDAACDQPASWRIGYVTSTWGTEIDDALLGNSAQRAFALDGHDRPGFVFYDRDYAHAEPDHLGGFYTWCESDCDEGTPEAPTWHEVAIGGGDPTDADIYTLPVLRYTSDDRPRVVVEVTTGDAGRDRMGIIYKSCDADCDRSASWTHTRVADRGYENEVSWDLALDAQDQPQIAFYQGSLEDGGGNRLSWISCTSTCTDPAGWHAVDLGLGRGEGASPDIELQPDGRPAISYLHTGGSGVYLARCVGDCTQPDGWRATILDTAGDLETDFPVARPFTCDAGLWDAEGTHLAFDSEGRMRIVYDAAYQARCLYEDPDRPEDPPYYQYQQVNHAVRILIWDEAGAA